MSSTSPSPGRSPSRVVVELAGVRDDLPASYRGRLPPRLLRDRAAPTASTATRRARQTAVLFGDSHAAQWLPALDAYARKQGWRLEYHTKSACSPVLLPLWERSLRREYEECFEWREAVMQRLAKNPPDVLYVGSSRDYEIWDAGTVYQTREILPTWREAMTQTLKQLARSAGKVVLMAETPFINYDPVDCLADPKVSGCDPPKRMVVDAAYSALEAEAAEAAGASVLNANELLCPGTSCPVVVGDTVVFRDPHHVTATYMTQLARPIGNLLEGREPYPSPSADASAAVEEGSSG